MRRLLIGLFAVGVLGILFVVLCTFVRRPYETVLLYRFGNLVGEKDQARIAYNWYLKWPTDIVTRMDTRIHLFPNTLQQVATNGGETISVRAFAAWRIKDPVKFYQTTNGGNDEIAQRLLSQKISGLVQAKVSGHALDDLFNTDKTKVETTQIEDQVSKDVNDAVSAQGLEIVQIGFSRMAFPPANAESVYRRMASEREQDADRFRAQGDAQADVLRAEGRNSAAQTIASAQQQAESIRGQGDAEALKTLEGVQGTADAREFYEYWKSMEVMKTSFTKNTYLVLPTDTPWLKALFTSPGGGSRGPSTQPGTPPERPTLGMTGPLGAFTTPQAQQAARTTQEVGR